VGSLEAWGKKGHKKESRQQDNGQPEKRHYWNMLLKGLPLSGRLDSANLAA
jgi:hypothetical protein